MQLSELDFELPERLIARRPPDQRDQSRLLVHQCAANHTEHGHFHDLPQWLRSGDLLVLNNSRVVPARMVCRKPTGGAVEGLWLQSNADGLALCMLSGGRLRPGVELIFTAAAADGAASHLRLHTKLGGGKWLIEKLGSSSWPELLEQHGSTPLPPYIRRLRRELGEAEDSEQDRRRYQTIWAQQPGSVAAPTASLHFSPEILAELDQIGVRRTEITLHVGAGTFLPVETEQVEQHNMHAESFELNEPAAVELRAAKSEGRRIIAVGTTACRLLESLPDCPTAAAGETDVFLLPGHEFRWVDALLTNFHTPKSTLLGLVAAFAEQTVGEGQTGLERVQQVYRQAIEREYRFFSYGDSSLWIP
jgi:S-adenosylmethionine:tRNA ribosyltransferase-isomerase